MQLSISPYASAQQTSKKKTVQRESAGDRSLLRASLSTWIGTHPSSPYPLAIGAVVLALLAGHPLGRTFGESILYIAIFPAIAFSAWYCGAGPSIVSMVVAVVGLRYWFGSPVDNFASVGNASVTIAFVIACTFIVAMGEMRRRHNEELRRAEQTLEGRVKRRTAQLDIANRDLRELTARLMRSQDDERRRLARELHDSGGQTLAALTMNLGAVGGDLERLQQTARTIEDTLALAQTINQEVRTVSYLLHPPLLDEAGLASAIRWYIEGFSERSKIRIDLDIPEDFGRLSQDLETAIFRTVQECLTNIHRHSGSSTAGIRLVRSADDIYLRIQDRGNGVPAEKLQELESGGTPGVGLSGMRERLRQLGGNLDIHSNGEGTIIEARVPLVAQAGAEDDSSLNIKVQV